MKIDDIKALVVGIREEYSTNDPYIIAEYHDLIILNHDLPIELDAYRLKDIIVLNNTLNEDKKRWILAHELGHYFIHGPEFTLKYYLKNNLLIRNKIEREADIFASELLLCDIEDYILEGLTTKQLSALFKVPEKYVEYKFAYRKVGASV